MVKKKAAKKLFGKKAKRLRHGRAGRHVVAPATATSIREALGIGRSALDEARIILHALNLG